MNKENKTDKLKKYFGKYLTEIRGSAQSTVKHYYDALNNISKRLREKGLIERNIYEVTDLIHLENLKEILYKDQDFIELNTRGKRMYSAGFNNYLRFARGEDFETIAQDISKLDIPVAAEEPIVIERTVRKRSNILRKQVLSYAGYSCEMNTGHESFIAEKSGHPYMEGHHAIPMQFQELFNNSLDVYANIVCLCPLCHRKIHYGLKQDRKEMISVIYERRAERLNKSGIKLCREEFTDMIMNYSSEPYEILL